jgi:drug/metabolite transporter (DMT)-like permease
MASETVADTTETVAATPGSRRILGTAQGTMLGAFGPLEWGLLLGVSLMWGSSFLFIAIGVESFEPGVLAFGRLALGAATIAFVPRARRPVDRDDLPLIAVLSLTWMAIPFFLFPLAEQRISSALAGMMNGAVPLFAALFASLMLKRMPGRFQLAGLMVGFGGVVAIAWPALSGARVTTVGVLLVLLAVILYGLSINLAVPLQQRYGALPILLRAQLFALAAMAPVAAVQLPASEWSWSSALAIVPLGVFGTGLAFVAMTTLAGRVGATRGTVAIYFLPVVAIALGVVFLDESVAAMSLFGTAFVIAGAWLTSRKEQAPDRA